MEFCVLTIWFAQVTLPQNHTAVSVECKFFFDFFLAIFIPFLAHSFIQSRYSHVSIPPSYRNVISESGDKIRFRFSVCVAYSYKRNQIVICSRESKSRKKNKMKRINVKLHKENFFPFHLILVHKKICLNEFIPLF